MFLTPTQQRRIEGVRRHLREHCIVWWSREAFIDPAYQHRQPAWHILDQRYPVTPDADSFRWVALCGYYRTYNEAILAELPRINLDVHRPSKAQRCTRCVTAHIQRSSQSRPLRP